MSNYYIVDDWDLNRLLKLAPRMDAPVRILDYNGVACSVHGEPLEFINGEYRGLFGTSYKKTVNENITNKIIYKINHPQNVKAPGYQLNRFIVAVMEESHQLNPISEVTNNGRCNLRCSQWARFLEAKHREDSYVFTPAVDEYNNLLKILSQRLVV